MVTSKKNTTPLLDQIFQEVLTVLEDRIVLPTQSTPEKVLFSQKDAAKYLGIGLSTLKKLRCEGRLKPAEYPGIGVRYRLNDLNKFAEQEV